MVETKYLNRISKRVSSEYYDIVKEILENEEFQKRKEYNHHNDRSVYAHSLSVSIKSYKLAKKLHLDYKAAAIGGLLHDFYYNDWQLHMNEKKPFFKGHGFVHAKESLENSKKYFPHLVNKKIENIIVRHMFPLNPIPPLYLESWIVTLVDKYVSLEIFKNPKSLPKYMGYKRKD